MERKKKKKGKKGKKKEKKAFEWDRHAGSRHPHVPSETSGGFHHISTSCQGGRGAQEGEGLPHGGLSPSSQSEASGSGYTANQSGCALMQGPTHAKTTLRSSEK